MKKFLDSQQGDITVEATIVTVVTLFATFILLGFGFLIYEQHNISVTAQAVATRIAQTYPYTSSDLATGEYTFDVNSDLDLYRYLFGGSAALESANLSRGSTYGTSQLSKMSLATKTSSPTCTLTVTSDGVGRRHIAVTISAQYEVLFGDFFKLFGFPTTLDYSATGYAECLDLRDYVTVTDFGAHVLSGSDLGSSLLGAIDAWIAAIGAMTS